VADITSRFNFANAMLAVLRMRGFTHEFRVSHNMDDEWLANAERYTAESIGMWGGPARVQSYPLDEPIVATDITPLSQWKKLAIYREVFGPRGLTEAVAIGMARQTDLLGYFAMNRHESAGAIKPEEMQGMRLIAPHLRRAITIGNLFDLKAVESRTFRTVLDQMSAAVVLVDEDLRIVHTNRMADDMLAVGALMHASQERLAVRGPVAQEALRNAVRVVAENEAALGQRGIGIPAVAVDGTPAVLHVLPLTSGDLRPDLGRRAIAAVFATPNTPHMPVDAIAALYDFTPAESHVFASLCAGNSLEETAESAGIAKSTARSHLLRLFAKTGCNRQAQLVALGARLSRSV